MLTYFIKNKKDKSFKHHFIRNALYTIWQKYKKYMGDQRPMWLVSMEVMKLHTEYRTEEKLTYKDLTYWREHEIKIKEEKDIPVKLGWWHYNQIKDLFNADKRMHRFKKGKYRNRRGVDWGKRKADI